MGTALFSAQKIEVTARRFHVIPLAAKNKKNSETHGVAVGNPMGFFSKVYMWFVRKI